MKNVFFFLMLFPVLLLGNNDPALPSKIKEVTVYLNGAQIIRTAVCNLKAGTSEITLTGLSTKIDENSIQLAGLQAVSILAMDYDINYLPAKENPEAVGPLELRITENDTQIAYLKNTISGLEEEKQVIYANRTVSNRLSNLSLEKVKEISTYYRERITAIKNAVFMANTKINKLNEDTRNVQKQLGELNNLPDKEQGELTIKFDTAVATRIQLLVSYQVQDAGWIPNYDIKSKDMNAPLKLSYKAHVYQKTGKDWDNVKITLSTGNPNINVAKPHLGTKYLNFINGYQPKKRTTAMQKRKYVYNPAVKKITGVVTDESGVPLAGVNVVVKGSNNGTQTDFDGYFSIQTKGGNELSFSDIGYRVETIPIYSSVMNIRMEEDAQTLEEVVVIGYGTSTRKDITGAVSCVGSEDISRTLQGRTAGIKIRGSASQNWKSPKITPKPPMYVIDGLPVANFVAGDLDEKEIQSIDVLKGDNAITLYGSSGHNGVVVITTKKSATEEEATQTRFIIKKPYSIASDSDITAIEINTFTLKAAYAYFAAPLVNENVFLTTTFGDWEQYQLLPGEASIYFKGGYAGKTTIDPFTTKKEMVISLGIDPNITVTRKQNKNFKSKSFIGSNRILDRTYDLEVKNNKTIAVDLKLMDRIPISQNKEIKLDNIVTHDAAYEKSKGLLTWELKLNAKETRKKKFSFQVKYPKNKHISI